MPPILQFLDGLVFELYTGCPSILQALVAAAKRAGLQLQNSPKLTATSAENVPANQRADIVEFTGSVLGD